MLSGMKYQTYNYTCEASPKTIRLTCVHQLEGHWVPQVAGSCVICSIANAEQKKLCCVLKELVDIIQLPHL